MAFSCLPLLFPRVAYAEDALAALEAEFEQEYASDPGTFPDPLESVNRKILTFNRGFDRWLFSPVARAYGFIVPEPVQACVQNFLSNLDSPSVAVNDLLQREWKDAGVTVTRFFVNTTVGVAGFFDTAKAHGLPGHSSDFGQTLALAGIPSGPFLMLPVLGPVTVRDGTGYMVDLFFQPTTWVLGPSDQLFYNSIHGGSAGIVVREAQGHNLEVLEESSIDFYAALRNAYYQRRMAEIWDRRERHRAVETGPATGASPSSDLARPSLSERNAG